ncbi:S-adenosyl-L-methionine-dependent methyltransferase [Entophlyctis helioformis]|nr:S-adenosyl-L-methionine-dependent methyltransferase [Entophlyctis helioformis]
MAWAVVVLVVVVVVVVELRLAAGPAGARRSLDGDDAVRGTNDDALVSKLSAVAAGYLTDPYAAVLAGRSARQAPTRRAPVPPPSVAASSALPPQPAGGLSLPLRRHSPPAPTSSSSSSLSMASQPLGPPLGPSLGQSHPHTMHSPHASQPDKGIAPARYFELDFPQITSSKAKRIVQSPPLAAHVGSYRIARGGTDLVSPSYVLVAADLRELVASGGSGGNGGYGYDPTAPTLFIAECVLVYLDPQIAEGVLRAAAESEAGVTGDRFFVTYEQVGPHDAFGRTMVANLRARGIELRGLEATPTLDAQVQRYLRTGWTLGRAVDLHTAWQRHLPDEEKLRVAQLEMFDEIEEWVLLSQHYCISWAAKSATASEPDLLRCWFADTPTDTTVAAQPQPQPQS